LQGTAGFQYNDKTNRGMQVSTQNKNTTPVLLAAKDADQEMLVQRSMPGVLAAVVQCRDQALKQISPPLNLPKRIARALLTVVSRSYGTAKRYRITLGAWFAGMALSSALPYLMEDVAPGAGRLVLHAALAVSGPVLLFGPIYLIPAVLANMKRESIGSIAKSKPSIFIGTAPSAQSKVRGLEWRIGHARFTPGYRELHSPSMDDIEYVAIVELWDKTQESPEFLVNAASSSTNWWADPNTVFHKEADKFSDAYIEALRQAGVLEYLQEVADKYRQAAADQARARTVAVLHATLAAKEQFWADVFLPPATLETVKGAVYAFVERSPRAPKGLLLYGPPGTGKTLLAKTIAKVSGVHFIELAINDLKGAHVGESGRLVQQRWAEARSAENGCVIFLDECDGILRDANGAGSDSFISEVVNSVLPQLDGTSKTGHILFIGATNHLDVLDRRIRDRLKAVEIALPDEAARAAIFRTEYAKLFQAEPSAEAQQVVAKNSAGFGGRKIANLVKDLPSTGVQDLTVLQPLLAAVRIGQGDAMAPKAAPSKATWDSLVLNEAFKKDLQNTCKMLQNIDVVKQTGIDLPRGLLLYGPPGTGKTEVARTLANMSGLAFFAAGPADLKAQYVGQSAKLVREKFEQARAAAPSILFIDEIDAVAARRDGEAGEQDGFTREIVAELLVQLDGVRNFEGTVFLVAATNFMEKIDGAVLSRLSEKKEVPLPELASREKMMKEFLQGKPCNFDVDHISRTVAERTEGVSGRTLRSVVSDAQKRALGRAMEADDLSNLTIEPEDISEALRERLTAPSKA
jgi:SpoVK/Ycf46/Vps4 family AAA+-type ATPase